MGCLRPDDDLLGISRTREGCGTFKCWSILALCMYILQFALSTTDMAAGLNGFLEFQANLSNQINNDTALKPYLDIWISGYVFTAVVCLSDLALIGYLLWLFCKKGWELQYAYGDLDKHLIAICVWTKVNFVLEFICEDCMVSLARILLTFKFEAAEDQLKLHAERIASIVTFIVSIMQLTLLVGQMVSHLRKTYDACTRALVYNIFCLFAGCVAVYPAGISMFVSLSMFNIDHSDPNDFYANIAWLVAPIFGLFIIMLAAIIPVTVCCCRR